MNLHPLHSLTIHLKAKNNEQKKENSFIQTKSNGDKHCHKFGRSLGWGMLGFSCEDVFRVACGWILANEVLRSYRGAARNCGHGVSWQAVWSKWAKPREVPFFADTLNSWYPFPPLAALLLVAALS